jgi:hypothetical protein
MEKVLKLFSAASVPRLCMKPDLFVALVIRTAYTPQNTIDESIGYASGHEWIADGTMFKRLTQLLQITRISLLC